MRDYFMFGGRSSADFGFYLASANVFAAPSKRVNSFNIPGRHGIFHLSGMDVFENQELKVVAYALGDIEKELRNLCAYLNSFAGYARYEDTLFPDEYRMAMFSDGFNVGSKGSQTGSAELTFDCMPQRWLKSGENTIVFTSEGVLHNPTLYEAKPLIRVYGTGSFQIGSKTITITKADEYTSLDCDIQDAYKDDSSVNCNGNVQITGYDFPTLPKGNTGIKLGSGITKVEIIPRWWTL